MDQHYSDLQLVRHDETARAPERDYEITILELDASALAPETVPDITPQVFYNTSAPELHENDSAEENSANLRVSKPKLKWPWMVMIAVATAITIGVGVGIGRHRDHQLSLSPQNTSSPNITRDEQFILNDTSLAALLFINGDRRLFFQDNTGLIRSAIRTLTDDQWSIGPNISVSSNVKKHTPLAVSSGSHTLFLYYVLESHVLCSSSFFELGESGVWDSSDLTQNYTTAENTRSLCIASIANTTEDPGSFFLFYENSTGRVSALLRSGFYYQYVDVSDQVINPRLSVPFTCPANLTTDVAIFYSAHDSAEALTFPGKFEHYPQGTAPGSYSSIHQSDMALFGSGDAIWINGTRPTSFLGNPSTELPDNTFPFTRLASVTSADGSSTFLYHQINGTTFAEEQWDASFGAWTPTVYITLADS